MADELVRGLRAAADFFEAHPEFPRPSEFELSVWARDAEAFQRGLRQMEGTKRKHFYDASAEVRQALSEVVGLVLWTGRENVCRKVVTGTKVVPATEEHEVETFEWECGPLLAEIPESA